MSRLFKAANRVFFEWNFAGKTNLPESLFVSKDYNLIFSIFRVCTQILNESYQIGFIFNI